MSSSCSTLLLNEDEPKIAEIMSASAVKMENMEQLMLTISFRNVEGASKMMTLKYNAQDNGYFQNFSLHKLNLILKERDPGGIHFGIKFHTESIHPDWFWKRRIRLFRNYSVPNVWARCVPPRSVK